MPQAMAPYVSTAAAQMAGNSLGAAATLGISAAVDAALIALNHFVGAGRRTANSLTQGLQQDFTDNVLAPLAVVNQTDPEAAHALMEKAWPAAYQKFEEFGSQGKNQRKVIDQMYRTPEWLSTVTSIMGRNPFTSQKQEQQTQQQDQGQQEQQSDGLLKLQDMTSGNVDAVNNDTTDYQRNVNDEEQRRQDLLNQQQQQQNQQTTDTSTQDMTNDNADRVKLADVDSYGSDIHEVVRDQNYQNNNMTNNQDYQNNTNNNHLQNYTNLLSLTDMLGNLFTNTKKKTTTQKQGQSGSGNGYGYGNIYVNAQGGNASNVNNNINGGAASDDPFGLGRIFTMPKTPTRPTGNADGSVSTGHTMDSMLQHLMQFQRGAA